MGERQGSCREPDPDQPSDTKRPSKQQAVIAMLQRPEGATVDEVASVTGWPLFPIHSRASLRWSAPLRVEC